MPSRIWWLRRDVIVAIHEVQIAEHGGKAGLRDQALLESALARPPNAAAYAKPVADIPTLAAIHGLSIIKNGVWPGLLEPPLSWKERCESVNLTLDDIIHDSIFQLSIQTVLYLAR